MEVENSYITSIRGKPKLLHKGFTYFKQLEREDKIYWRCTEYDVLFCNGRVNMVNDNIINETAHTHEPMPAEVKKQCLINSMKEAATTSTATPMSIVSNHVASVSNSVKVRLPKQKSLKRVVQRVRAKLDGNPEVPQTLSDFIVPENMQTTENGDRFLQYDSGSDDPKRIIIFSTESNMRLLSKIKHWFADGTFDNCPNFFAQLYTIHGYYENVILPLVYVLLPDKTGETYIRLFQELKRLRPNLKPESCMTDFELAAVNGLTSEFPTITIRFCLFHMRQSLYRKLGEHNLKTKYDDEEDFNIKMKMLSALAFVPVEDVISVFDQLMDEQFSSDDAAVDNYLIYFQNTYIGKTIGRRFVRPLFNIERWSQYDAVKNNLPRTNNSVEGWHRGFEFMINKRQANIYDILRAFKDDEALTQFKITQLRSGAEPEPPRKKYASLNARLERVVSKYGSELYENDTLQYLADVAALLSQ